MIEPTWRVEKYQQGTKRTVLQDGRVDQITVNGAGGSYDIFVADSNGFRSNVFEHLSVTGSGPGSSPFGTLMTSTQDERDSPAVTSMQLRFAKTYAQNNGTPDPAPLTFDVKVDGVSVLAAPVEVEFTGSIPDGTDNVVVPLPLAGASVIVPGLSKIEVICSGSWSGNEEGGDFPPSFLGLAELEVE